MKRQTASGAITLGVYSQSGQLVYEENGARSIASEHIYLVGSLLATRERAYSASASTTRFQHTDALGSPVAVTDLAAQVVERMSYEPYGLMIGKPSHDGIGYTGHVQDAATGLTYMQQRYYDPMLGVFLSVDPITAYGSPIGQFHRYRYANGNPYKFMDPDGRQVCNRALPFRCGEMPLPGRHRGSTCEAAKGCLSGGDGEGKKESRSPEEEDYYAERAKMADRAEETFSEAGKFAAKEAGWMLPIGKMLGGLGRLFGKAGRNTNWAFGAGKTEAKWASQMERRGWTPNQITEAIEKGKTFPAENLVNKGNSATRYVHPETGRSVVVDDVTREVIHVGGNGFGY